MVVEELHHARAMVLNGGIAVVVVIGFAPCPYCDGHGRDCDECEGTGVITRRFDSPSDALDKELEALEAGLYRAWLREYEG